MTKVVLASAVGLMLASAANAHSARTVDSHSFKAMGSWNVQGKIGDAGYGRSTYRFHKSAPQAFAPNAAPAPEPGTWAMMLIGAGLVAFQLRRKQQRLGTQAV